MPEMERAHQKYQIGQVWIFQRISRFLWKKSLKKFLSSNIFHTNYLNFLQIQTVHINFLFNARGLKLCHFAIFDAPSSFPAFFKLPSLVFKFSREMWSGDPSCKGPIRRRDTQNNSLIWFLQL